MDSLIKIYGPKRNFSEGVEFTPDKMEDINNLLAMTGKNKIVEYTNNEGNSVYMLITEDSSHVRVLSPNTVILVNYFNHRGLCNVIPADMWVELVGSKVVGFDEGAKDGQTD